MKQKICMIIYQALQFLNKQDPGLDNMIGGMDL